MFRSKYIFQEVVIALMASVLLYTGLSKFLDYSSFTAGIEIQPLPDVLRNVLVVVLPFLESLIPVGLLFHKTRPVALAFYSSLMLTYTIYTGLIVFAYFNTTPCGCGGIHKSISWDAHFVFTVILLGLSLWSLKHHFKPIIYNQEVS